LVISARGFLHSIASNALVVSFVVGLSSAFTPTAAFAMECSAAVADPDGDGWGYENNQSCRMATGFPTCSSNAVVNGRWGFENGRSCRADGNSGSNSATASSGNSYPSCTSAAINSGNGWGYENNRSCRYTANSGSGNSGSGNSYPSCTSAAINNGNGWGYENFQSCRFDGNSGASGSTATAAASSGAVNNSGLPECSANADDNGNGFGFEFGASCVWGSVQPIGNGRNDLVVAPPPVTVSAIGYEGGTPICLTDASDGNAGASHGLKFPTVTTYCRTTPGTPVMFTPIAGHSVLSWVDHAATMWPSGTITGLTEMKATISQ